MVEYVLASSPGGQELDAQIIKAGFVSFVFVCFYDDDDDDQYHNFFWPVTT